jgi:hypothetical protein
MELLIAIFLFVLAYLFIMFFYELIDWFDSQMYYFKWKAQQRAAKRRRKLQDADSAGARSAPRERK